MVKLSQLARNWKTGEVALYAGIFLEGMKKSEQLGTHMNSEILHTTQKAGTDVLSSQNFVIII
jgi:hypothetical protein